MKVKKILRLILVLELVLVAIYPVSASVPPPDMKYHKLVFFTGPGALCMSGFYIQLGEDEHVVMRKPGPTISQLQLELGEGRMKILQSFSGKSEGREYQKLGNGRLLVHSEIGQTVYSFDDFLPGTTEITSPAFVRSYKDNTLLRRINFTSDTPPDTPCLAGTIIS